MQICNYILPNWIYSQYTVRAVNICSKTYSVKRKHFLEKLLHLLRMSKYINPNYKQKVSLYWGSRQHALHMFFAVLSHILRVSVLYCHSNSGRKEMIQDTEFKWARVLKQWFERWERHRRPATNVATIDKTDGRQKGMTVLELEKWSSTHKVTGSLIVEWFIAGKPASFIYSWHESYRVHFVAWYSRPPRAPWALLPFLPHGLELGALSKC